MGQCYVAVLCASAYGSMPCARHHQPGRIGVDFFLAASRSGSTEEPQLKVPARGASHVDGRFTMTSMSGAGHSSRSWIQPVQDVRKARLLVNTASHDPQVRSREVYFRDRSRGAKISPDKREVERVGNGY